MTPGAPAPVPGKRDGGTVARRRDLDTADRTSGGGQAIRLYSTTRGGRWTEFREVAVRKPLPDENFGLSKSRKPRHGRKFFQLRRFINDII